MSNKERDLIDYLNKFLDLKLLDNRDLKEITDSQGDYHQLPYYIGYEVCVRDVKLMLLKILKNEEVLLDECLQKKSS